MEIIHTKCQRESRKYKLGIVDRPAVDVDNQSPNQGQNLNLSPRLTTLIFPTYVILSLFPKRVCFMFVIQDSRIRTWTLF